MKYCAKPICEHNRRISLIGRICVIRLEKVTDKLRSELDSRDRNYFHLKQVKEKSDFLKQQESCCITQFQSIKVDSLIQRCLLERELYNLEQIVEDNVIRLATIHKESILMKSRLNLINTRVMKMIQLKNSIDYVITEDLNLNMYVTNLTLF